MCTCSELTSEKCSGKWTIVKCNVEWSIDKCVALRIIEKRYPEGTFEECGAEWATN